MPRPFVVVVVIDVVPIRDYDDDNDQRRSRKLCTAALTPSRHRAHPGRCGIECRDARFGAAALTSPLLRRRSGRHLILGGDVDLHAAILAAASRRVVAGDGPVGPDAFGSEPRGVNTTLHQGRHHGLRALL